MDEMVTTGQRLTCGTLHYTMRALALVFIWLMIGGFSLALFTSIPGRMLPVFLEDAALYSDFERSIVLAVIGNTLNMIVCPYISFKSDRYRSRWGRRIPFILYSLPFIVLSLILFGYAGEISAGLVAWLPGPVKMAPATVTVVVVGCIMFMFQFANMYVNSVFWYLFNDVIPVAFFAKVMGAFNVATAAGNFLFSYFIFQYAASDYTLIFVSCGILYGVGMGLMCLFVKEGEYPPVEGECTDSAVRGWRARLRERVCKFCLFFTETFSCRFYVLRFLLTSVVAIASVSGIFAYNFNTEMGLNKLLIGRMDGINGAIAFGATLLITIFATRMIDHWHPMRVYCYNIILTFGAYVVGLRYLGGLMPPDMYVVVAILGSAGAIWLATFAAIASLPMEMLTFPKSRFGQFCSAQALLRSSCVLVMSGAVGGVFDLIRWLLPISETYNYRFVPVWSAVWMIPAVVLTYLTFREWHRLGGAKNYRAPAPWSSAGSEVLEQPDTLPPSRKWLRRAFGLYDVGFAVLALQAVALWWVGREEGIMTGRVALGIFPPVLLACGLWWWVRRGIGRDVGSVLRGEKPVNGIPNHGMLFLGGIRFVSAIILVAWPVLSLRGETGFYFLLAAAFSAIVMALSILLVARMERGAMLELGN